MNLSVLRADTRDLTDTDTTSYPNTRLDRNLNQRYQEVMAEIITTCDDWDLSGKIAKANVQSGVQGYSFPTGILTIKRAEISFDGSEWQPLGIKDISMFNEDTSDTDDAQPISEPFMELHDNGFYVYPTPTANVTDGLKIWYQKEPAELSGTSDEPKLITAAQRLLPYGASMDFWIPVGDAVSGQLDRMEARFNRLLEKIKKFYSFRTLDNEDRLVSAEEYFAEEYGEDW